MSFTKLGLNPNILKAIEEQGYTKPTLIQEQAIPKVLEKKDLLAAAQTGTGKTAAFTLPLLEFMSSKPHKKEQKAYIKALILVPTRELALQVFENIQALRKGVDIVIATPGRLIDHMSQNTIDLSRVDFLVLDEADRMLDMGFIHDIKKVVAKVPSKRQTLLFSATFSDEIKKLSNSFLTNPETVEVARSNTLSEQVSQAVHYVTKEKKKSLLAFLIHTQEWNQVLVFTRTKHGANRLSEFLNKNNISSLAIHGNKSQGARTTALKDFKSKKIRVLVATDIAARGIDIELLPHVINYELPNVPEDYVHRIGRTGRAGNVGEALSLVCDEEAQFLEDIEKLTKTTIPVRDVEGFTLSSLKKPKKISSTKNKNSKRNSSNTNERRTKPSSNKRAKHSEKKDFKKEVEEFIDNRKRQTSKKNSNRKITGNYRKGQGSKSK